MALLVPVAAALISLVFVPARATAEGGIEVYYPPDFVIVEDDLIFVEGYTTDPAVEDIEISVNSAASTIVNVRDFQFSEDVYLDQGRNVIRVGGVILRVFYDDGGEDPPPEYQRVYGHFGLYDGCLECHEVTEEGNFSFSGEPGETCGWCHDDLLGSKGGAEGETAAASVHGPVREVKCLLCHRPHLSKAGNLLVEKVPECRECHPAVFEGLERDRYVHGPLNLGDCSLCHVTHSSPHPSLLKEKLTNLCTKCHSEVAFDPDLPEELRPHTMIPEGECGRCHSPHSSDNPKMMIQPSSRLCYDCHAEKRKSFHEEKGFSIYVCQKCHDLHRPTTRHLIVDNSRYLCLECHEFSDEALFTHEFIKQGGCFSCHTFHSSPLSESIGTICLRCHGENTGLQDSHGGVEIMNSRCTACHLPHQADKEKLLPTFEHTPFRERNCVVCHDGGPELPTKDQKELCLRCHGEKAAAEEGSSVVHQPVREEDCSLCHMDHVSGQPFLLRQGELDTCLACHREFKKVKVIVPKSAHEAVLKGECHLCHDAHASPNRAMLISPPQEICDNCHGDLLLGPGGESWAVPHPPAAEKKCRLCHRPHTARVPNLLKSPMPKPCRPCHTELFSRLEKADEALTHRPVAEGNCVACHEVHGSDESSLLDSQDRSNLCARCHRPSGKGHHVFAPAEVAARTGVEERNNPCLMCHQPHAAAAKNLVEGAKAPVCQGCHQF